MAKKMRTTGWDGMAFKRRPPLKKKTGDGGRRGPHLEVCGPCRAASNSTSTSTSTRGVKYFFTR